MDNFDPITGKTWDGFTREAYWEFLWRRREEAHTILYTSTDAEVKNGFERGGGATIGALVPALEWAGAVAIITSFAEPYINN